MMRIASQLLEFKVVILASDKRSSKVNRIRKHLDELDHGLLYFLWMVHSFEKFQNTIFLEIFEIPAIG